MPDLKSDIKHIQELTFEAYKASGGLLALLDGIDPAPARLARLLEQTAGQLEQSAVELRALCERHQPRIPSGAHKPAAPWLDAAGFMESNSCGWLHIQLNTLLPGCRFAAPRYLTDTLTRLLDQFEQRNGVLPLYDKALLVIDEHCDIQSRQVYDQDNKAWKSIPNVFKGRCIPDDDQFTLGVCLLSQRSGETACHIYLLPLDDAEDFFFMRTDRWHFRC